MPEVAAGVVDLADAGLRFAREDVSVALEVTDGLRELVVIEIPILGMAIPKMGICKQQLSRE